LATPPAASALPVGKSPATLLKYADIGINLGDLVYQGVYHGKAAHESDLKDVIQRALAVGCVKMMVTGSDLKESRKAVKLAEEYRMFDLLSPSSSCNVFSCSLASSILRYVYMGHNLYLIY
jgi:hypothetical protein